MQKEEYRIEIENLNKVFKNIDMKKISLEKYCKILKKYSTVVKKNSK
jgi:predicted solute-binding protein